MEGPQSEELDTYYSSPFLINKKMADFDIDPFDEHESRPEEPTDEHIPLIPGKGVQTWEPRPGQSSEREQETSFTDNERKEELVRM